MKKLVLKKDIVARINGGDMNQLRGGYGDSVHVKTPVCNVPHKSLHVMATDLSWLRIV